MHKCTIKKNSNKNSSNTTFSTTPKHHPAVFLSLPYPIFLYDLIIIFLYDLNFYEMNFVMHFLWLFPSTLQFKVLKMTNID